MRFDANNSILTLFPEGRIDSGNAASVEEEIQKIYTENTPTQVIVNADKLDYISSAGLRIILRLKKQCSNLKIINVSSEVYDVFDMTGFTEMIKIEKRFRVISVDGCDIIGQGANGIVYRFDPETIIKVYRNPDALDEIRNERELARKAFVNGIPTAIPYDIVKVGESFGSVFELLDSKSLMEILCEDYSQLDQVVDQYIGLLRIIHSKELPDDDLPNMKEVVLDWVDFLREYLEADVYTKLRSLVEAVPEENHLIHGDYHAKNIMIQNREALIIDMDTLAKGNPVFEFASIFNAYIGFSAVDRNQCVKFLGIDYSLSRQFWLKALSLYFLTDDVNKLSELEEKAALLGYTRLMRRTIRRKGFDTEEGRKSIEYYKNEISSLVNRVESLIM